MVPINETSILSRAEKLKPSPSKLNETQTYIHKGLFSAFDIDDEDIIAEEGLSPAILGGFAVPVDIVKPKVPVNVKEDRISIDSDENDAPNS